MAQIAAYADVKVNRTQREIPGGYAWRTPFLVPPLDSSGEPHAFLAEGTPQRTIGTHFHIVDQFQVIVSGGGVLGKHDLAIHAVHFARAHTPYGPIIAGKDGLGFLTLRATRDPGAQHFPAAKEKLMSIPNRNPWQVTEAPRFEGSGEVVMNPFSMIKDGNGLAAFSLKMQPGARTAAPDPASSGGQYLIVTKGSVEYQGKDHPAITIIFVKPHEKAFDLIAGAEGMEALVLNYPRQSAGVHQTQPAISSTGPWRVWQCQLCSFSYDEAKGMPGEGIAPATRWEDVPETWTCPDCSTSKSDFDMVVVSQ
jgi:rubredoxin